MNSLQKPCITVFTKILRTTVLNTDKNKLNKLHSTENSYFKLFVILFDNLTVFLIKYL